VRQRSTFLAAGFLLLAGTGWSACRPRPEPRTLFAQAEQLRHSYETAASRQAIAKYQTALAVWERQGRSREAAEAAQGIGATYEQLGSLNDALGAYLRALSLAQRSGDHPLESEIHSAVGFVQSLAGSSERDLDEALSHCERALTLARQSNGTRQEAAALNCAGEVDYNRGNLERALTFYQRAESLWSSVGDQRGRAETWLFQGYVYSDLSELDRARSCYEAALSLWTSLGDKRGKAITFVADARLRQRRGEYQEALNRYLEALSLLELMGDAVWEVSSLTGIADVYLQMAQTDHALKSWERALQRLEAVGMKNTLVDVLIAVGETYLASGDDVSALNRFERALALAGELGNLRFQSYALRNIGGVYVHRHLAEQARPYLERSLRVQQPIGDRRLEAQIRADIGDVEELLGEHHRAVTSFEDALGLSRDAKDRLGEARALFGLAHAAIGLEDLDAARRYSARSLEVAESLRSAVQRSDLRASYLASVHAYYELHVEVLMRLHDVKPRAGMAAAAFEAAERARARSLLDNLTQAGIDLRKGLDPDLLKREEAVKKGFEEWAERQRRSNQPLRDADAGAYRDLEDRYDQIQVEIRSRSPRYAALTQPQPLSLAAVQKEVLADDTLLLEYALGEKRSFLWAVSRTDHVSYELPPQREIELLAQRVYERLTARLNVAGKPAERRRRVEQADDEYWQDAQRLSEILLGPVTKQIRGKRILVVADGALQYLPFAALPVPGGIDSRVPMVTEHEIVGLPSASVLAALRNETKHRKPAAGAVAVFADPVFEADDPRLRGAGARAGAQVRLRVDAVNGTGRAVQQAGFLRDSSTMSVPRLAATRQEADAIVAAAQQATTMKATDFDASRATAMSADLAGYRILHFATHGVFNNEQPGLSGIVLSMFDDRGQAQDGFLRLHDIYSLNLPAELVVLSACNTALGKSIKGEGLVGIVRGFMYAGAKRVVASHWKVDDEATSELMGRFYEEMFRHNLSPAAALRQAQLAMRQHARWQSPFYWAAFVLQGEWR
jgi:CHAT domain-containing protein/tetratricopeptide (TPR) repeat protein